MLTREVCWFVVIGVASTVAQALLYWVLRHWSPPVLANFASLLVVTVLNTEADRRLTFRRSGGQSGHELAPHQPSAQMPEQPEREHEVHPDARGEASQSSLACPGLVQYRIHQLGRDDLR